VGEPPNGPIRPRVRLKEFRRLEVAGIMSEARTPMSSSTRHQIGFHLMKDCDPLVDQ
jgi:hypothetical protein